MTKKDIISIALLATTVLLMTAKTLAKCDFMQDVLEGSLDDIPELPDVPDIEDF